MKAEQCVAQTVNLIDKPGLLVFVLVFWGVVIYLSYRCIAAKDKEQCN